MRKPIPVESEVQFGRLVVNQGLAKPEQVEECMVLLRHMLSQGAVLPRLGELMVRRGLITVEQQRHLSRMLEALASVKAEGLSETQKLALPADVAAAWQDPSNMVGKYIAVAKVGAGAMGEVWKAWDPELRRWVALKFLRSSDVSELARFKREAQTNAKLHHPNICSVYEVGEHQGRPYFVMQFADGKTLATFPRDDRRLLVKIVRDAALAIHYAHEQGIVHRDLKPSNLMVEGNVRNRKSTRLLSPLQAAASGLRVYVMDFGLARPVAASSDITQVTTAVGTPAYMSPEQARGDTGAIGPKSDVYALGVTLYELLTDRLPYQDPNVADTLRRIAHEEPPRIETLSPSTDPALAAIVHRAMSKDPAQRPPTALKLAEELTDWLIKGGALPVEAEVPAGGGLSLAVKKGILILAFVAAGAGLLMWIVSIQRERDRIARREAESAALGRMRRMTDTALQAALAVRRLGSIPEMQKFADTIRQECEEASAAVPDSPEPHYVLGRILRLQLEDELALREQDRALQKAPGYPRALYERIVLRVRTLLRGAQDRRWAEAARRVREGGPVASLNVREEMQKICAGEIRAVRSDLARLHEASAAVPAALDAGERAVAGAVEAWLDGKGEAVREALRPAFQETPPLLQAYELLSEAESESGRLEEACRACEEGATRDKGYAPLLETWAHSLLLAGLRAPAGDAAGLRRMQESIDLFDRVIRLVPGRVRARAGKGVAHWFRAQRKLKTGDEDPQADLRAARALLSEALQGDPKLEPELRPLVRDCEARLKP